MRSSPVIQAGARASRLRAIRHRSAEGDQVKATRLPSGAGRPRIGQPQANARCQPRQATAGESVCGAFTDDATGRSGVANRHHEDPWIALGGRACVFWRTNPPPPAIGRLEEPRFGIFEDDATELEFTGTPGREYTLQGSTDLIEWLDLVSDAVDYDGKLLFEVPPSTEPLGFFRARGR
jgi:hypothetical protein